MLSSPTGSPASRRLVPLGPPHSVRCRSPLGSPASRRLVRSSLDRDDRPTFNTRRQDAGEPSGKQT